MKIWAVKREYLKSICADAKTIEEAYDFFDELSEQHNREELRMWANNNGTSYEIRAESIDFVFNEPDEFLDDLLLFETNLYYFLEEVKKLFEANNGMSSLFLEVER